MKLIASLIVRNEWDRYLPITVEHLLGFCDEIRILDDASTDSTLPGLASYPRVKVLESVEPGFYNHEGEARQRLLEWTLAGNPTHVLAIDADEFISDGAALRTLLESSRQNRPWRLCMQEVWHCDPENLWIRQDGGWRSYEMPALYSPGVGSKWSIPANQLACGRVPEAINSLRSQSAAISIFHFGWTNQAEREQRYARYVAHDGGRFHASRHLESIMWPEERIRLYDCTWPAGLQDFREHILERTTRSGVSDHSPERQG